MNSTMAGRRGRSVRRFVGLLVMAAVAGAAAHSAATLTVSGTVRTAGEGRTLDNVEVTAEFGGSTGTKRVVTGADGRYVLRAPNAMHGARVPIMFRRLGYEIVRRTVEFGVDSLELNVPMKPSVNLLTQVVTNAEPARVERNRMPSTTTTLVATVVATGVAAKATMRDERRRQSGEYLPGANDSSATPDWNREQYDRIQDNPFLSTKTNALSTFSVDVDRASYGNVRRFLTQGQRPPADAVRIEELVNYFPYALNSPTGRDPVAITTEVAPAPWQPKHQLVRIALQARRIDTEHLPASNLVFLIDVSGSMSSADKLPLVKSSLRLLVEQLRPQDHVAMVVYAGAAGLVLPSTSGEHKSQIMEAIDRLESGGSTAGGAGIELAYKTAKENFLRGGNNRVILATDGDFNVGASSDAAMERLIESKRIEGTYLTVLGYGRGNYQDAKMEKMAKVGNGNYAYVDDLAEARKVLVHEMGATLVTVANDVKLQIEFNPALVSSYRLIGYEDRLLANEDFNDDKKDAGDMGAGHTVTALYEVVPVGVHGTVPVRSVDPLRYATPRRDPNAPVDGFAPAVRASGSRELLFVKLRYKQPGASTSQLMTHAVAAAGNRTQMTDDFRFAAAVAEFGMVMRASEYKGDASIGQVIADAREALGDDAGGYRREFVKLAERWRDLGGEVAARRNRDDR